MRVIVNTSPFIALISDLQQAWRDLEAAGFHLPLHLRQ
jgi:hypothetical protein